MATEYFAFQQVCGATGADARGARRKADLVGRGWFWSATEMSKSFPFAAEASDLRSRAEVLRRPSPVPSEPGVYAWYFRRVPTQIDATGCHSLGGMTLLYGGISPKEPPATGRPASRSTLRKRLRTHFRGNADGSTLRKTLGCLLAKEAGFPLRRVGSGSRQTFTNPGEQALDACMAENAFVLWHVCHQPWSLEFGCCKRLCARKRTPILCCSRSETFSLAKNAPSAGALIAAGAASRPSCSIASVRSCG